MEDDRSPTIFHTVAIRPDLRQIRLSTSTESIRNFRSPDEFWLRKLSSSNEFFDVQYSRVNGPYTTLDDQHPVLSAFLQAYNFHEDLILSPDDFWLMISIYFSIYVNENRQELFDLYFDNNESNRILTIENEQNCSTDWEDFLQKVHFEMKTQIKFDLCQLLKPNFSTTTDVESLLSSLLLMSTFQKCTEYRSMKTSCGIRNVHFLGTFDDWILLEKKIEQLKFWTKINDEFSIYLDGILPIFRQFIETYRGEVDQKFWEKVFDVEHENDQSNQSDGIHINGWFLKLCYGNHRNSTCSLENLRLETLIVPVQVEDENTKTIKTSLLLGGFHGVDSFDGKHKPVLSFLVVDDRRTFSSIVEIKSE